MKLLLYCCKNPHKLYATNEGYVITDFELGDYYKTKEKLNGKIVAECDFEVEWYDTFWHCVSFTERKGLEKSCLTAKQLFDYVKGRNEFYAIHIKNLHIFYEPKYLSDCWAFDKQGLPYKITNAPQNMMKVTLATFMNYNNYVLISIQPQWLCKILNGEKTIEVRKKVLKEMLE